MHEFKLACEVCSAVAQIHRLQALQDERFSTATLWKAITSIFIFLQNFSPQMKLNQKVKKQHFVLPGLREDFNSLLGLFVLFSLLQKIRMY